MSNRSRPMSLSLAAILTCGLACVSYAKIAPSEIDTFDHVRVVTSDGTEVDIEHPKISADTLYGTHSSAGRGLRTDSVAIPLDQIVESQSVETSAAKTVGLVVGIVGVAGLMLLAFSDPCPGLAC